MKFITCKDMIKLNHVLWGGMQWESRYGATRKSVKKQCCEDPKYFLKCVQNRVCDRTTSSVKERSEAGRMGYFHFIRFGPSGCGGRFCTEQIQVLIDPSGLKASVIPSFYNESMQKSKVHLFLILPVYPICIYSTFCPCSWSSGQWASPLNNNLLVRTCLHF